MNISLTPELKKFVEKEVGSGLYRTASEVVRAGLRRLKEDQAAHLREAPRTLEDLETQLLQSIGRSDHGEGIEGEGVFRRLRKRIRESRRRRGEIEGELKGVLRGTKSKVSLSKIVIDSRR